MNKRARMRLLGVTGIILALVVGIVTFAGKLGGASDATVAQVSRDSSFVGKRVKVSGAVVPGSYSGHGDPMRFEIREESDKSDSAPTLKVVYTGTVPSTFGDGVVAIVTGVVKSGGEIEAAEMITKCPSKYESAQGAMPVADLMGSGSSMTGKTVRLTGYVSPGTTKPAGTDERFVVAEKTDGGGKSVGVTFDGALPDGMKDGKQIVLTGALEKNGRFVATNVALEAAQQGGAKDSSSALVWLIAGVVAVVLGGLAVLLVKFRAPAKTAPASTEAE